MNRTSKIAITAVLTLGLVGGVTAFGKHRHGDAEKLSARMIEHISEELDLNSNQVSSLEVLKNEMLNIKTQMHGDSGDHHEQLRQMILADQFDQARLVEMIENKTEIVRQNSNNAVAALGNFIDGLNQEQKAELVERMEKRRGFGHRHGRGHKRGHRHGDDHDRYENHNQYDNSDEAAGEDTRDDA